MLPTETQVIDYIAGHPRCKSKEIARHFGCTTGDINRAREGYLGIYKLPNINHDDYTHTVVGTIAASTETLPSVTEGRVSVEYSISFDEHYMLVNALREKIKNLEADNITLKTHIDVLEEANRHPTLAIMDSPPETAEMATQTEEVWRPRPRLIPKLKPKLKTSQ